MKFDLVSDIHVESWKNNYDFLKHKSSKILVVAGDIADHVEPAVDWLTIVSAEYQHVLVITGNHEYQGEKFPLNSIKQRLMEKYSNVENVHFLENDGPFIHNNVAFIGRCGWWDYVIGEPHVDWKTSWDHFSNYMSPKVSNDILAQSAQDYADLLRESLQLQINDDIEKIVVVTHTLSHRRGISWGVYPNKNEAVGCYGNSLMEKLPIYAPKCSTFCFGHNHDQKEFIIHGREYHSHPRGRPEDFNRTEYRPKIIQI